LIFDRQSQTIIIMTVEDDKDNIKVPHFDQQNKTLLRDARIVPSLTPGSQHD